MKALLIVVYALGSALEIGGVTYAAKTGIKPWTQGDKTPGGPPPIVRGIWYPESRQIRIGLCILFAGIAVSLLGNILSVFVS